ncbi:MAG: methionine--tRNA ligase [Acidilobaceae archaeon]|nr:methionine--tRNA ligase [Acidilobaceae archaeon]MCX8165481.1 methionine--tRNA ligase [Acidilobaceae archaeon]MDW7973908.1 methionine--tRNA ligase [Sulfolobales archaeon]
MRYIVTAAWPYVNYIPHLGTVIHIVSADIYARYLRLRGHEVIFVTGSDEHGTPIELEARKKGLEPKELTSAVHRRDLELFTELGVEFSLYSRTESEVHKEFVKAFMSRLMERGYVFEQDEVLPYCEKDKMFLPDRFVEGKCPNCGYDRARGDQCDRCGKLLHPSELLEPRCALCGSRPLFKLTRHWYIDLGRERERLLKWLESNLELQDNVREYSLNWVTQGLKARSVTRDTSWGIEAPFAGAKGKTIYVWFDALLGYVSATIEYLRSQGREEEWKSWWMGEGVRTVYFIGKDNIPFHSIIFPAMLLASGEPYVLPWRISATEYLLYEGSHFSKSRRVGIWVDEALELLPGEYWRWILTRLRPEGGDQNFTWSELYRIVNSELNDDIGNYVNRTLSLIQRAGGVARGPGEEVLERAKEIAERAVREYDNIRLKAASEQILELARLGNRYLNEREPWHLLKSNREEASRVLWSAASIAKMMAHLLAAVMPKTAERLWSMLGLGGQVSKALWDSELYNFPEEYRVSRPEPLFTKLPPDFLERLDEIIEEARRRAREKRPPFVRD